MNCKQAEKLLVEFLYQELSAKKTVAVEKHLQVCDQCTRTLENWQAIHRGYRKSSVEAEAPPYLKQRILVAAREELTRKPSAWEQFNNFLKPAVVMPVIVFLVLALFVTRHQEEKPAPVGMAQKNSEVVARQEPAPASREISNMRDRDEDLKRASKTKSIADDKERGQFGEKSDTRKNLPAKKMELSEKSIKQADQVSGYEGAASEPEKTGELDSRFAENKLKKEEEPQAQHSRVPAAPAPAEIQESLAKVAESNEEETFQQAQYWFKNNQLNQGKIVADDAISKDKSKSLASPFHQAGIMYQQNKEPQKAIVQFNLVLNNYPDYSNSPDVLVRLGDSYAQIGQYENAIKVFQQLARFEGMRKVATERISNLRNQQKVQEQLRSLGYVDPR